MPAARLKQVNVFIVKGSLNHIQDIKLNTIAPIAKPIKRDGHSCPSKNRTVCLTVSKYSIEMGIPSNAIKNG